MSEKEAALGLVDFNNYVNTEAQQEKLAQMEPEDLIDNMPGSDKFNVESFFDKEATEKSDELHDEEVSEEDSEDNSDVDSMDSWKPFQKKKNTSSKKKVDFLFDTDSDEDSSVDKKCSAYESPPKKQRIKKKRTNKHKIYKHNSSTSSSKKSSSSPKKSSSSSKKSLLSNKKKNPSPAYIRGSPAYYDRKLWERMNATSSEEEYLSSSEEEYLSFGDEYESDDDIQHENIPVENDETKHENVLKDEHKYEECEPVKKSDKKILDKFTSVTLQELMSKEGPPKDKKTKIQVQYMKCVAPLKQNEKYNFYNQKTKQSTTGTYIRMHLVRIHTNKEGHQLAWLIENKQNKNGLFHNDRNVLANGELTIGKYFAILNPKKVTGVLRNNVPIIETNESIMMLKKPIHLQTIPIIKSISANFMKAAVYNNVQLTMFTPAAVNLPCGNSGGLCDHQNWKDWKTGERGCGCFHMEKRAGTVKILHNMRLKKLSEDVDNLDLELLEWTSTQFTQNYLTDFLPDNLCIEHLASTHPNYDAIFNDQKKCIKYVNKHGGFTIIIIYCKGEMHDASLVGENDKKVSADKKQDSTKISKHVAYITPTNTLFGDFNSREYYGLQPKKFDVRCLSFE